MDELRGSHEDVDGDSSEEYSTTYDNGDYHDSDDAEVLTSGHAASAAEERAITVLVRRYYRAAAAGQGQKACSLMALNVESSIVQSYGLGPGPAYLHGGKSCREIMSRLFRHDRAHLTAMIYVTGVRILGEGVIALVGSHVMPAGELQIEREHGAWRIGGLLAKALP